MRVSFPLVRTLALGNRKGDTMMAIVTKFHGPSNVRGARYSARTDGHSVILSADDAFRFEGNHRAAAVALCAKLGWEGTLAMGVLPDGRYVHVFVTDDVVVVRAHAHPKKKRG